MDRFKDFLDKNGDIPANQIPFYIDWVQKCRNFNGIDEMEEIPDNVTRRPTPQPKSRALLTLKPGSI